MWFEFHVIGWERVEFQGSIAMREFLGLVFEQGWMEYVKICGFKAEGSVESVKLWWDNY